MDSQIMLNTLAKKKYSFDTFTGKWLLGQKEVNPEEPLVYTIRHLKRSKIENSGEIAEIILSEAEYSPETTFRPFKLRFLPRSRGSRVRGSDVFSVWSAVVGLPIDDPDIGRWCRNHSEIVGRFYSAAKNTGIVVKPVARIPEYKLAKNVFCDVTLVRPGTVLKINHTVKFREIPKQADLPSYTKVKSPKKFVLAENHNRK